MISASHNEPPYKRLEKVVALLVVVFAGCRTPEPLALWNETAPAKNTLVEYVRAVTDEDSSDFIPPERRIAVFDLDGTLFCETAPTYFDWLLFEHRVLDDGKCNPSDEQIAAARASREKGIWPALSKERELMVSKAYRGMTLDEFDAYVRSFMDGPQAGFSGMKRGEAFYRPMVEVVEYLVRNGFVVYVSSGTDRLAVRAMVRDMLPLPPRQIIGTDNAIVGRTQGDTHGLFYVYGTNDELTLNGTLLVKNLQMNKVTSIVRDIGEKPVLAFGNSMTDASMANYVIGGNRYRALAFMVLCDDTVREYGNLAKAAKMRKACAENGWIPISMRDDWKTIYGPGVSKTSK